MSGYRLACPFASFAAMSPVLAKKVKRKVPRTDSEGADAHREVLLLSWLQPRLQPYRMPVATGLYDCDMDKRREEKLKMQRIQSSESLVLNDITGQPEPSEVIPGEQCVLLS